MKLQFEKKHHPGFTVVGIACRASNSRADLIQELWQRFTQEKISAQLTERASDAVYALYCDYESDHTGEYSLVIGCEVPPYTLAATEPPPGLVVAAVPAAFYGVIDSRGPQPQTTVDIWKKVWTSHVKRTYVCDFEVYWGPVAAEVFVGIDAEAAAAASGAMV